MDGVVQRKSSDGDANAAAGLDSMPGIIPRPDGAVKASVGTKMAVDLQHDAIPFDGHYDNRSEDYVNGSVLTNGNHEFVNGTHANGISATPADVQRKTSSAIEALVDQLPPELEHITFGYARFSTLISRLVQETFLGLTEVISDMSEILVPSAGQYTPLNYFSQQRNGIGENSGGNVQKKLRMLNFTSDRRAQFIKILILLRWARQAEAVSKVIDLNVWTNRRLQEYRDCISWVGELKRILVPLRDPNPDIKTALEVLSLVQVSWLPNLGYIPPEPLSSQQLLNTLRKINILLSIRLNLHESIPPPFKDFSIASGRVTFRVPEEFEVDLSVAEEDPSSQLYFIEFRFTFSPTPANLPTSRLRDEIEGRANDILKRERLEGLFNFLHNLTLTHKLSVLRSQAYDMARGCWSEQLKVEGVQRSLVVQYWPNRSGGKNWIEIGLRRGTKAPISYALNTWNAPNISLRWFCGGREITDVQIVMRLGDLSLADILKQVIALHTSHIFEQIALQLKKSVLYSESFLRLKGVPSATEPMDASLFVQLTTSNAIKVVQEPLSGKFSILPASQLNSRAENEFNRLVSPTVEGAPQLTQLRSFVSQEEADIGARHVGWEPIRSLNPNQETIQKLFGKGIQNRKFFRKPTWSSSWILAFTSGHEGDFWWIMDVTDKAVRSDPVTAKLAAGSAIRSAYKVQFSGIRSRLIDPSPATLASIENTAACMISHFVDTRALLLSEYPHKVQMLKRTGSATRIGSLLLRMPSKVTPSVLRLSVNDGFPWLAEIIRLDYLGLDSSKTFAIHVAHVQMQQSITGLQNLLSGIPSITFEPAGEDALAVVKLRFSTQVGETVVPSLRARLRAIGLLLDFASILKSYNLICNAGSLTRLVFDYASSNNPLRATIHFPDDTAKHISLSKPNPHLRIVDYLSERLRIDGLSSVIGILRMTLDLLRTFLVIESCPSNAGVDILARSDQWYQVRYSEPYSKGGFDVYLQFRRDDAYWFIPEISIKKPESVVETFEHDLRAVMRGKGNGWRGVKGGMIAHIKGIGNLIVRLDEVFRTSKHVVGDSNPRKRKSEEVIVEID